MTARILTGDCRAILPTLDAGSVHCVVTSPPYFGLRDYGTAQWSGGDAECDHKPPPRQPRAMRVDIHGFGTRSVLAAQDEGSTAYRDICGKCGAVRQDRQIGLESSLDAYIAELVTVFREVRRVLRDDGTCWLNLGDSYARQAGDDSTKDTDSGLGTGRTGKASILFKSGNNRPPNGLKPKDLMMVPARVALALQADGWYLRSDIIWAKKAPMPESVQDRPTSAHEHVFLLTKKPRYYFDMDAVREPVAREWDARNGGSMANGRHDAAHIGGSKRHERPYPEPNPAGRNLRNVWHLGPQSFAQAHFATFPTTLVEPCIKAGTSEKGCCAACGAAWVRVVEQERQPRGDAFGVKSDMNGHDHGQSGSPYLAVTSTQTIGWKPSCHCNAGEPIPCTVLDPFMGAGTVALVADRLGRDSIGIELNESYAQMARDRISGDCPMFAEVVTT